MKRWIWNGWDRKGPVEVECTATGKPDYFFVVDAEDAQGGRPIHISGLFETRRACLERYLTSAVTSVRSAEHRVVEIKLLMEEE